jgi:hypothetical protein
VNAALSAELDDAKAAGIAIRLVETADPPSQAVLEVSADLTPEDVERLSYSELIRVAQAWGIGPSDPSEAPVDGSHGLPQPAVDG